MASNGTAIIGADPVLVSSIPIYDTQNGLFWEQVWEGSDRGINLLLSQLNLDSDQKFDIDPGQSPLFRLTVKTPDYINGQSSTLNKFELVHNKIEKDLFEFGTFRGIDQDSVVEMKRLLKDRKPIDNLIDPTNEFVALYSMELKGTTKFFSFEWVFRHSITTSRRYGVVASQNGVETLWSTAQLLNPSVSGIIIPSNTLFALGSIPTKGALIGSDYIERETVSTPNAITHGPTVNIDYYWRWLKQPPDIEQLPSGKMVIRQEWWLDLWPSWIYALHT